MLGLIMRLKTLTAVLLGCGSLYGQLDLTSGVPVLTGESGYFYSCFASFPSRCVVWVDSYRITVPKGAFYAFPLMQEVIDRMKLKDDVELGEYLINEAGVALVPGSAFGAPGYMRLSFATGMDNLKKGLQRITASLKA